MKHKFIYIFFLTTILLPGFEKVFAVDRQPEDTSINNYSQCSTETTAKSAAKLTAERAYVNRLFSAQARRQTDLIAFQNAETRARAIINASASPTEAQKSALTKATADVAAKQKEIENADKIIKAATNVCGANAANQKEDQEALQKAVDAATGIGTLGTIPNVYIPISPIPKELAPDLYGGVNSGIGGYQVNNLVGAGFTLAIAIGVLLSVVMLIQHGLSYILSADSFEAKKFNTERITEIVTGLIILLCSIVILRTIDPAIIELNLDLSNPSAPGNTEIPGALNQTVNLPNGAAGGKDGSGTSTNGQQGGGAGNTGSGSQNGNGSNTNGGGTINNGGVTPPVTPPGSGAPAKLTFCYQYRQKIDNALLPRKCIIGFEGCVTDKKKAQKTGLFKSFTQCKLQYTLPKTNQ